jgi:tRNA G46 methylase TrmB
MFYGCEPHLNGIVNLLDKLQKQPLANLKINNFDVRILQTTPTQAAGILVRAQAP